MLGDLVREPPKLGFELVVVADEVADHAARVIHRGQVEIGLETVFLQERVDRPHRGVAVVARERIVGHVEDLCPRLGRRDQRGDGEAVGGVAVVVDDQ